MDQPDNIYFHKEKIISFFDSKNRMPSYSEAAKLFGLKSKDSAYRIISKLVEAGVIDKDDKGKIIPGRGWGEVKILGLVEAGFPTPAEEDLLDTTTLDSYLIKNREATFMLRVKGDSMQDAGIVEGDMVLVERASMARPGQIVIADLDGGWTMKYLRKQGSYFYLEPANKKYKPIFPKENLQIAAVVKAVIRKY